MGASQSSEKRLEIINDTKVQTSLKNINKNINKMTMNIVQENLIKTAAGATVKQEIKITGLKAEGDITISGISQKADVEISVSSLSNSELQQDLVTQTMNELQTKLQESMKMSQEAAEQKGEQFVAELAGALSGAIASATGTSVSEKSDTSIQNLLDIKSEVELQNIVEQSVSTDLINRTIAEIANTITAVQSVEISNIESTTGGIVVSNIDQEFLSKQMLEAISIVGTGAEIISEISNSSKADIEKSIEAGQTAETEEEGTFKAAGGAVAQVTKAVGDAWTNFIKTGALTIIIPILVVGVIVLFMFRGLIGTVAKKKMGIPQGRPVMRRMVPQMRQQMRPMMRGGAKGLKSLYKQLQSFITKNSKKAMKYATMKNLIILAISIVAIVVSYKAYQYIRYNRVEGFTTESKKEDLIISHNGKFLKNKKLGDEHLCFKEDKETAYKFSVSIINDKDIYIVTKIGDNKYYLRIVDGEIIIEPYDFINDSSYKFQFTKTGDVYNLSQGDNKVSVEDECLVIGEEPADLLFE